MKNLNHSQIQLTIVLIVCMLGSIRLSAQVTPATPIVELSEKPEFKQVVSTPFPWDNIERTTYTNLMAQPRFSFGGDGATFDINNIDHLRVLKDRLDILPQEDVMLVRNYDFGYEDGVDPQYGNPCNNGPLNIQKSYNKLDVRFLQGNTLPAIGNGFYGQEAFGVKTVSACNGLSTPLFFVSEAGLFGFGNNTPQSTYHFSSPNFQVGNASSGIMFKIDNANNTLSFNNGGMRLFQVDVEGKLYAREFEIISNIPVPDYVFASTYKLKPLTEVEAFIIKYKHLPGIKSAAEYEKDGVVNIGELQMQLLEKVEELTLHAIAQQKLIEAQQKQIQELLKLAGK